MRQDPQVIMVGEIRDPETAAIAVQAGPDGAFGHQHHSQRQHRRRFRAADEHEHRTFLARLQRDRRAGTAADPQELHVLRATLRAGAGLPQARPAGGPGNAEFRRGAGCDQCLDTGFSGRNSVGELLAVNQPFREAVMDKVPTRALQQVAIDSGMQTMWQRGLRRALTGQTTLEEILRVISVDEI